MEKKKKRNKFNAVKTTVNGIKFDSKLEAKRYGQLILIEKGGLIKHLKLQVPFRLDMSHKTCPCCKAVNYKRYVADFTYIEDGQLVVEDAKGKPTVDFRRKKRLMKAIYGIDVKLWPER
jgi:hypothetical protein